MNNKFTMLKEFEGIVLYKCEKSEKFFARMSNLSYPGKEEGCTFDIEAVSERDIHLIEPGTYFYWGVGRIESRSGQKYDLDWFYFYPQFANTEQKLSFYRNIARALWIVFR